MSNIDINLPNFGFSKKPLSIFANNIDGMSQKFDQLLIQLSALQNKFDFIAITETNINESHKNLYKIPGYAPHFNYKYLNKRKGSGVVIYVNEFFTANPITELQPQTLKQFLLKYVIWNNLYM